MATLSVLDSYRRCFTPEDEVFLHYYDFGERGQPLESSLTRGRFLALAEAAAGFLKHMGLQKGDHVVHCFGRNHHLDLVFRLAGVFVGTVAVTVNWQADDAETVRYKIELTAGRLIIYDKTFAAKLLEPVRSRFPNIPFCPVEEGSWISAASERATPSPLGLHDPKMVIFTSGTTGKPKGVAHAYRSYATNRQTFESFLDLKAEDRVAFMIVNPLHHANATAITDLALSRPRSFIHLFSRYSTPFWELLTRARGGGYRRMIAPVVARHFDFLAQLEQDRRLPLPLNELRAALGRVDFLVGSAPVGPTTVQRIRNFTGRLPLVRFGSTETCLQVMGIPKHLSDSRVLAAFEKGWRPEKGPVGYYIGRPHPPFTRVAVVAGVDPEDRDRFLSPVPAGECGYIITKGDHIMTGYVKNRRAANRVIHEGWYTGLMDMGFFLIGADGERDFYWVSRESSLLIRGGANYAYEQINQVLTGFLIRNLLLNEAAFDLAVVGIRVKSEHEDSCCLTIQFSDQGSRQKWGSAVAALFKTAHPDLPKFAHPEFIRFAAIPRNFKGAVLVPALKQDFRNWLAREDEAGGPGQHEHKHP